MSKAPLALWINKESICAYNILDTNNFVRSVYVHSKMSCMWKTCSTDGALDSYRWIWTMKFPKVMSRILMSSIYLAALQALSPPIRKAHKSVVFLPHFCILCCWRRSNMLQQPFRVFAGWICKTTKLLAMSLGKSIPEMEPYESKIISSLLAS